MLRYLYLLTYYYNNKHRSEMVVTLPAFASDWRFRQIGVTLIWAGQQSRRVALAGEASFHAGRQSRFCRFGQEKLVFYI